MKFKIITLNVWGLNKTKKRRAIFRQLHVQNASIAFLQETHSATESENLWSAEWGGKIYFNHGSKHSRGTGILFDCNQQIKVNKDISSNDGRILILDVEIDDQQFALVNIYAPNEIQALIKFFKRLEDMLQSLESPGIVLGGDFNCPLTSRDKPGSRDLRKMYLPQ